MRRSQYRRETKYSKWFTGRRRIIAAVATVVAFGGIVTVTQVSDASTKKASTNRALSACNNLQAPKASKLSTKTRKGTYTTNGGKVTQHADDGAGNVATTAQLRARCRQWVMQNAGNNAAATPTANTNAGEGQGQQGNNNGQQGNNNNGQNNGQQGNNNGQNNNGQQGNNNGQNNNGQQGNNGQNNNNGNNGQNPPPGAGLGVLANSCEGSQLQPHDGFQNGNRCVSTEFGEVGTEQNNPTLLITEAPEQVGVNQPFTIQVSTRNLIRDRFLAAGQGGYYVESSLLQGGLVRGHFHSACRILESQDEAPDPAPAPAFFVATEDNQGGAQPDTVNIQVPGLPEEGTFQCSSWAGDGSHRIPMMQRANQTPAFDSVRVQVGGGGNNNDDNDNNGQNNNNGQQGNNNGQNNNGQNNNNGNNNN